MDNINHKNYFAVTEDVPAKPVKPIVEEKVVNAQVVKDKEKTPLIVELDITDKDVLFALNKNEQIDILKKLGVSASEIKKLRVEKKSGFGPHFEEDQNTFID
jgi:hypothetical protein